MGVGSVIRAALLGLGLAGAAAGPAHAYVYGYPYGYGFYGFRPFFVPFYPPPVVFVPPRVVFVPPPFVVTPVRPVVLEPAVVRPRPSLRRRVVHRALAPVHAVPQSGESPFSGPGAAEEATPASAPAAPRAKPGFGDLPKEGTGGETPPVNVFPPETGEPGFGGF